VLLRPAPCVVVLVSAGMGSPVVMACAAR